MQRKGTRHYKLKVNIIGALIIWITLSIPFCKCKTVKTRRAPETSLLTTFVQRFIQPYMQSLTLTDDSKQRSLADSPVKKAILKVIKDLKPFLQDDNNNIEGKIDLDGNDETTIIEFLPKTDMLREGKKPTSELKLNIRKYEKIKSDIKAALENEAVSEKTKKTVTNTLDELIAQLIGNQCSWSGGAHLAALFRTGKEARHNITIQQWEELKTQYIHFLDLKQTTKSLELFNKFHKFFTKMINDTQNLPQNHKIKCQLIQVEDNDNKLRIGTENTQGSCGEFKICSKELKEFLIDFYKSLNDTTVSVFKNYAAMYGKDVLTDDDDGSHEIDSVPSVLDNMSNVVENRVSKVFIQELNKLKLHKNKNKEANIKILHEFVTVMVKRVLTHTKKHLPSDLVSLRASLHRTVKQDINVNLDVDLGNLEADTISTICTVFVTCNGKVAETRKFMSNSGNPGINRDSVYVKLQLKLDDRSKEDKRKEPKSNKGIHNNRKTLDNRKYYNIHVTRTTIGISTTNNVIQNIFANNNDVNIKKNILEIF